MYGIILTSRASPVARGRAEVDRVVRFPSRGTTGADDRAEKRLPRLRMLEPKSRRSRKGGSERARRLLAADLTYLAHPSFDDPSAGLAILAPAPGPETPEPDRTRASRDLSANSSHGTGIPTREQEAHQFRKMNYLKCLACRIRDHVDPDSPDPGDLDEIERLRGETLKLRNQIVETHLRLAFAVTNKHAGAGSDLAERTSEGTFALMQAVDRFDFARGNRFSTYATWAIYNGVARYDRKERHHRNRSAAVCPDSLATPDSVRERYVEDEAREKLRSTVQRLLRRLNRRERAIIASRHGIGGAQERTFKQIGVDLGISKERVRQIHECAHAKLRSFARLEAIEPSDF